MNIEKYSLEEDIQLICVQATSFPMGVQAAFQKLHALAPPGEGRKYFGISRPDASGAIIYKAAAEKLHDGEGEEPEAETFTIKEGNYTSIFIADFMKDIPSIGKAFNELLAQPGIDPNGYCLEWYEGEKDVRCMVPMK